MPQQSCRSSACAEDHPCLAVLPCQDVFVSQDSNLQDMVFVSLKRNNPVSGELNYKQCGWLGRPWQPPQQFN